MTIFRSFTPLVEPISLDEAFLDVTGARRLHGDGPTIAAKIRAAVLDAGGPHLLGGRGALEVRGQAGVRGGQAAASAGAGRIPGSASRSWSPARCSPSSTRCPCRPCGGSGPKTLEKLAPPRASTPWATWPAWTSATPSWPLGAANGAHLRAAGHGLDDRDVVPHQRAKSIGHEETFAHDHHTPRLAAARARPARPTPSPRDCARRVWPAARSRIKVRFHDFRTITRSVTLPSPIDTGPDVVHAATELLAQASIPRRASGCSACT